MRTPPEHVQVEIWDLLVESGLAVDPEPDSPDSWGLARESIAVQLLNAWMLLKVPEIEDMIPNRWGRTPESSSA